MSKVRAVFANRNALVDVLAIFFGVGTWIGINSTYVQLPLLVNATPEGWNLASYIVIIIQVGNIGPLLYTLLQKYFAVRDNFIIYFLLAIGIGAGFGMAFLYEKTAYVFGDERSVAIFANVFFFALVGCTSSVLFMPYFGRFRDIYLITYLIGEGLSGFLPALLALVQGVGGNAECILTENGMESRTPAPRFGTQTFFLVISSLFLASFVAFMLLDQLKSVRKEYAASVTIGHGNNFQYNTNEGASKNDSDLELPLKTNEKKLSDKNYRSLLMLLGLVCCFSNAIFPSIMSFGTLPYGNVAYHFAVTLSSIANPVACFIAVFVTSTSIRNIVFLCVLSIPFAAYSITTAAMSPSPPLLGNVMGDILVVRSNKFKMTQFFIKISTGGQLDCSHRTRFIHSPKNNDNIPLPRRTEPGLGGSVDTNRKFPWCNSIFHSRQLHRRLRVLLSVRVRLAVGHYNLVDHRLVSCKKRFYKPNSIKVC